MQQWLTQEQPDVILLQETKCQAEAFPYDVFESYGYQSAVHGQKTFNGVAILSRYHMEDVHHGLPTFMDDPQARYIEAVIDGHTRVASVYVPNGQSVGSDKYDYKLTFLQHLQTHMHACLQYGEKFVVGGDYNIAPTDTDIADPAAWHEEILCSTRERKAFKSLENLGYYDAIRLHHQGPGPYTWWDYRSRAWSQDKGLRIDHFLISAMAADHCIASGVDRTPRGWEKTSDHAPVWCVIRS